MKTYINELMTHINEILKKEGYAKQETEDDIDYVRVYLEDKDIILGIPFLFIKQMKDEGKLAKEAAEELIATFKEQCDMVEHAMEEMEENESLMDLDDEFLKVDIKNLEEVKESIFLYLINYEKNKTILEYFPHKRFLDLAVVFGCISEYNSFTNVLTEITNEELNAYGITVDALYELALNNMIEKYSGTIEYQYENGDENDVSGYILSNNCYDKGAGILLYYDKFQEIADINESDLLIVPVDQGHLYIVPCPTNQKGRDYAMIQEYRDTISGILENEDVYDNADLYLSDNIYIFNRTTGITEIAAIKK